MKSEWKEYKLGDIASMKYGKMLPNKNVSGKYPVFSGYRVVGWTNSYNCKSDTPIVVARGVGGTGDVKILKTDCFLTNLSIMVDIDRSVCHPYYFYYKYRLNNLKWLDTGSAQSQITIDDLRRLSINLPPLPIQRKIASILSTLDDKIETNNAICRNLEEQAMALFKKRFYSSSGQHGGEKPVYDFAEFINGTAFKQREYGSTGLPIIKIAELKSGITSSTLLYSGSNKDEKYYIQNGDILFSWSGNPDTSIDVFIWARGDAILNQHIFNVKSRYGAKWFTYLMLKSYMPVFAKIAMDKQTTGLGHVTVADLKRLTFSFNLEHIRHCVKKVA